MKKLLSILGACVFSATATGGVVACGVSLPPAISLDQISKSTIDGNVYMKSEAPAEKYVSQTSFKTELISLLAIALKLSNPDTQQLYTQINWKQFDVSHKSTEAMATDKILDGDTVVVIFEAKPHVALVKGNSESVTFNAHIGDDNRIPITDANKLTGDNARTIDIAQIDSLQALHDDLMGKFLKQNALLIRNATSSDFIMELRNTDGSLINDWTICDLKNDSKIDAVIVKNLKDRIVIVENDVSMEITVHNTQDTN